MVADIATRHAHRNRHLADLDTRPGDRLPAAALRRHTEIRDRTCTFAGVCRRPAHAAEQDHRRDHTDGGLTVTANLGPTCAQDHTIKHRAGWTVHTTASGQVRWHSPLGGHYTAHAEFLCAPLPEPAPRPDPSREGTLARINDEAPILTRPPPPPAAADTTPPVRTAGDDEPPF